MRYRIESAPGPSPRETEWRAHGDLDVATVDEALVELRARVARLGLRLSFRLMQGDRQIVRVSPGELP